MKKLLEAAVLAGVLLLASGCGSAEMPENKETYSYASYAHPEMVGAIDVSSILSVAVNRPEGSWRVSYNPEKDTEAYYSAWEVQEGFQTVRKAVISGVRTLFEAVETLAESRQGQKAGQIEEGKSGVTVIYEDQSEHEVLSVRFSLDDLPEGALMLQSLTAFDLILKLPVIENLVDLKRVELYFNTEKVNLSRKSDCWVLNGKEITQEKARALYQIVMGILLQGELEDKSKDFEVPGESLLTVRYIEKAGRTVEVIFGPSNDYRCQVEIDGAEEFWVYEEDVENIISTFTKELQ